MSWKSPIEVVYNDLETNFEDGVFKAIQRVQINVDKDELMKALQYDRDQYEKGYEDGKRDAEDKIIRCKDCKHKPTGTGKNHDVEFPEDDYKCPCRCEDDWYSWIPEDNWFCANAERKE